MSLLRFDLEQGLRKGTPEDPFVILGVAVKIREHPPQMDHVMIGPCTFGGESIPYQPFGFEYKSGYHVTAVFIPIDRKHRMGQSGELTFTMTGMRHGTVVEKWKHTARTFFSFEYQDGSTEWVPPKRKDTILNHTLFAHMVQGSDDKTQYILPLDHSRRKRKSLYVRNIWDARGYPVRITVPNGFYHGLKQHGLVRKFELQWRPDSGAEIRARLNKWVWGKEREYLNMRWEDFVMKMRDGDFRYYQWHPAGKMEVVSYANFLDIRDSIKYWDDTYGKLFQ